MKKEIFNKVMSAYKTKDVTDILRDIGLKNINWYAVGGKRNNSGIIDMGADPASALTERITNAIDAVLEKEWINQGSPSDISSPRLAVKEWFGIPKGQLSQITDSRDERLESLSDLITISFHDSDKEDKPTVEIRDKGIGLKSEQFKETILNLNGENKIGKLHLMGAYGQGGSTALSFSNYTIIVSKSKFDKNKASFTIVRVNQGDIAKDKNPWYEYMVDKKTGHPFQFEISNKGFEEGTLIRHILMDLGKYKGTITTPSNSLWYLTHHYLFDPVIPFKIEEKRSSKNLVRRKVTGNNRILTTSKNREYFREIPLTFRDGSLKIYYWVLSSSGDDPRNRIKHYTTKTNPIIITFNGQKQGYLKSSLIKNDLKLPYLESYLVVQIEADNVDNETRRKLFSSTRESVKDTSVLEELKQTLLDVLGGDEDLKRLDKERRQRYYTKEDTEVLDSLRKRLARRINVFLKNSGSGSSVTAKTTNESNNIEKQPEIPIEDPPTFFEIITPSPKEVIPSKTFFVKFRTDAHPSYFSNPDTFIAFIEPQSIGIHSGTTNIVDGYGKTYFKVNQDVEIGDLGEITLELRPPRQKSLTSTVSIEVVEPPKNANPKDEGNQKTPNIEVHYITDNHPLYKDLSWNEYSVAKVNESEDGVIIYVNEENKNLKKLVIKAVRHSDKAVENIKNKYLEHISFHSFILEQNNKKEFSKNDEVTDEIIEMVTEVELKNASETICGMINDFFEPVITESIE